MSRATATHWPGVLAKMASALGCVVAVLVLLGWSLQITVFKSVLPNLPPMPPRTAVALLLAALSLGLLAPVSAGLLRKGTGQMCALAVTLIGAFTSVEYVFRIAGSGVPDAGRPALLTATNLVLLGAALLLLDSNVYRHWARDLLSVISVLVALLALIGYACNVPSFYGWRSLFPESAMSLHGAVTFAALGAGILCARPERGLMRVVMSATAGGVVARRLLLAPIVIPLVTGLLQILGRRMGLYNAEFAGWFFAFVNIFVFVGALWWVATLLYGADEIRLAAEQEVRQLNAELEERVAGRTAQLKEAEATLREKEERLRLIIDTALDGVITIESSGVITGWSRQSEAIFGWPAGEVLGRCLSETIIPPAQREAHERGLKRFLQTREGPVLNRRIEVTAVHRSGKEIPIELAITPVQLGGRYMFSAFVRDITERTQADRRLRDQLGRLDLLHRITRAIGERQDLASIFQVVLSTLEDSLPADFGCICVYDQAENALVVSTVGTRSAPTAVALEMTQQSRIPVDENGLSRCLRGRLVYEGDVSQIQFPFPQRLARGGLRSLVAAPLLVESRTFGILIIARGVTDAFSSGDCEFLKQLSEHVALATHQAQLYTALQEAYDDLRQTQQTVLQQERLRALGQMASGIAHDINNAISPVALYTESLLEKEPGLSPRAREYLETIQRAIDDVAQTVARMREFYRQREPQLALGRVDLNELTKQVLELTRARWSDMPQQRGVDIEVRTELTPDLPPITGVESEIREALTNLVFNAVDAMPNGGTLVLRTRARGIGADLSQGVALSLVDVEVTDTGLGMDEHTRRRCMEPFFTTKGERGTGLGLAMVYGTVQRHKAGIEIESAPGQGTTVRLSFPLPTSSPVDSARVGPVPAVPPRMRILIVDDDPLLLKSLRDILERDGHVVTAANNGQAGIDTFRKALDERERFAIVITDLGMPYVDGRKVATAVKTTSPSTPVILLTGWGDRLAAEGDVPPHVDRLLSKPPKLRELREALAQCSATRAPEA